MIDFSPQILMADTSSNTEQGLDNRQRVVIMTGATRGIGRAIVEQILKTGNNVLIVNFGRSSGGDVQRNLANEGVEDKFPNTKSGERIKYISGVDLSDDSALEAAIQRFIADNRGKIKLVGIIHCAGEAVLCDEYHDADDSTKKRVDSMRKVNGDAAVRIATEFASECLLDTTTPYIYVGSLAAYPNRAPVPGLGEYGETKKNAMSEIADAMRRASVYGPVCEAFPGIYKTGMVFKGVDGRAENGGADGFVDDVRTGLEFSGIVAAKAETGDPLIENIVNNLFAGADAKKEIFGAHIPAAYVKYCNYEFIRIFALPIFVMLFGNQTLEETNQTPEQHDARVDYHKEHQSYGKCFPYFLVKHRMLWSSKISKWLTKVGRPLKLV